MDRAIRVKRHADAMQGIEEKAAVLAEKAGAEEEYETFLQAKRVRDVPTSETLQLEALNELLDKALQADPSLASEVSDNGDSGERNLEDVDGIGWELAENLRDAGIDTPDDLRAASDEDLLAIEGIGEATLKKIRADL